MKKYVTYFSMLLVSLFVLTGCGEEKLTPTEEVGKALKNIQELTSGTIGLSMNAKMTIEGVTVTIPIDMLIHSQELDKTSALFSMHFSKNVFMKEEIDSYIEIDAIKGETILYMPSSVIASSAGIEEEENYWVKQTIKNEEAEETNSAAIDALTEQFENLDFSKILTDDDLVFVEKTDEEKHYTLNITQDLINRIGKELGEEGTSEEQFVEPLKAEIYINTKESQITKISMDLSDFLKNYLSKIVEEENLDVDLSTITILNFGFDLTFTDYNTTTVTIPEEVKKEAISLEEYYEKIGA